MKHRRTEHFAPAGQLVGSGAGLPTSAVWFSSTHAQHPLCQTAHAGVLQTNHVRCGAVSSLHRVKTHLGKFDFGRVMYSRIITLCTFSNCAFILVQGLSPRAVVTDHHKPAGLKQQKCIVPDVETRSPKSRCWPGRAPFEGENLRENPLPLPASGASRHRLIYGYITPVFAYVFTVTSPLNCSSPEHPLSLKRHQPTLNPV